MKRLTILVVVLLAPLAMLPFAAGRRAGATAATAFAATPQDALQLGDYVLLAWNDLGMHCMNQYHEKLSVLPPFNNLHAQLIRRGDATHLPQIVTTGVTLEYSIPGNTYSVGKTDFWTYAPALFGVTLPPNVGLTGKGLTGTVDLSGLEFVAPGIPITPFTDAAPTVEAPYQQALVIARDGGGNEIARSTPVLPVSIEIQCVSSGCHASDTAILERHEAEHGFDPAATPILCAGCHADPALGTTGNSEAGYFSMRMHDRHDFLDQTLTGAAVCYKCHPGTAAQCLRGVMSWKFGMICQDCHGNMVQMAASIRGGRTPWLNEPRCGNCHMSRFAEPGQLFRLSSGHSGVMCEGCHNSTHAEWPSREAADNANSAALQGHAGVLAECRVCHASAPTAPGPHGISLTGVEDELLSGAEPMRVFPNPTRGDCSIHFSAPGASAGTLMVFDQQGRAVRLLRPRATGANRLAADWDGLDATGIAARPGIYFVRWQGERAHAAAKLTIMP